jgi:hypothetical protein
MDRDVGYLGTLLGRDLPLAATVGLALVSGLDLSPAFDAVSFYLASFGRNSPLFHPELFYHLTSLAISAMTLLLAGIPAALYERMRGLQTSSPVSLAIWLVATLLLALPVILRVLAPVED